mmetsp:Transcript_4942/g.16833  ORF Transcript_4942/g.16833 Transcript_4942/m.16833 type:complete len:155 (+) Transcript_4942:82-546(+)
MAPAKDADLEPENWVMPEVLKPDEKELMETITRSARRNTYDNAKKETKGKRMSAREEGDAAAAEAEKIAADAARRRKKKGGCCGGGADDVVARKKFAKPGDLPGASRGGGGDDDLAVDSFWAPFNGEVDVAVDAFDFAGGELPSAGEPFVAVQQ